MSGLCILVRSCSLEDIYKYGCPSPSLTKCEQNDGGSDNGTCICKEPYTFNPKYTNDSDYCLKLDNKPSTGTNVTDNKNSNSSHSNNFTNSTLSEAADHLHHEKKVESIPGAHHIVAGILIPIVFVFVAIGIVIIYKKLHITQRIRNIQRTRRNRPFYEDVMLGSNDIDDPPLI